MWRRFLLLVSFVLLAGVMSTGTVNGEVSVVNETFDSGLGVFHLEFENHDPSNNFGWSNTNYAGDSAGELGGIFARHSFAYVGAGVGLFGADDTFTMRGKAYFKDVDFDGGLFIGFFKLGDPPDEGQWVCGISITEPREPGWRVRLQILDTEESSLHYIADQTQWSFDLTYSNGVLSGTIGPTTEGDPLEVSLAVDLGDAVVDAFGVGTTSGDSSETCELYLDDLEFSVDRAAHSPDPPDGYENVCPEGVVLWWEPGASLGYGFRQAVYFGTDSEAVTNADTGTPDIFKGFLRDYERSYYIGTLSFAGTYYWRIDEHYTDGEIAKGNVWSFSINDGRTYDPSPLDGASEVRLKPTLHWSPGCYATHQDVYFGTSLSDVNNATDPNTEPGRGRQTAALFNPGELDAGATYYWRVDAVNEPNSDLWKGRVWRFTTILDPNLLLRYKFDETSGNVVHDSSGNDYHGSGVDFDEDTWDPNDGRFGGSINMDSDQRIDCPLGWLAAIDKQVTISLWTKAASRLGSDNWIFSVGYSTGGNDIHLSAALPNAAQDAVIFQAGNDVNDRLEWTTGEGAAPRLWLPEWHHFVFIKNENTATMSLYLDGLLTDSLSQVNTTTLAGIKLNADDLRIGAYFSHDDDFHGKIDDFRIYDYALSQADVAVLFRGEDLALAWAPDPYDGEQDVRRDVKLIWQPGDYASSHDVYFGTSWDDVNDANTAVTLGVFKGNREPNEYDPPGDLTLDTTYYWRIDEVNDTNNDTWKGRTWRFTVANYIVIDDMEAYDPINNRIYYTWIDGIVNETGSEVGLGIGGVDPVHRGGQSMIFDYDNDDPYGSDKYSEIYRAYSAPQNWTETGVKIFTLFFYGGATNDANDTERMYVGLEDSRGAGSYAEIRYGYYGGDMNDIKKEDWTQWDVALSDFNGVQLSSIKKVYIGFGDRNNPVDGGNGVVYFDDIRLYPPKCVPWRVKPAADFTDDCVVDFDDVRAMAGQWLRTDANLSPVANPGTANLVGWWKLDDGDGNTAADSSSYANHGTIGGSYSWVAGHSNSAVQFVNGRVLVPDAAQLRPAAQVSASVWIYYSGDPGDSSRVVVKGADNFEAYCIEVSEGEGTYYVGDVNGTRYFADSDEGDVYSDEWVHLAGTYDGATVKFYVNGQVAGTEEANSIPLSQDANGLGIANRSDDDNRPFKGTVDEVRIYNRALLAAEVGWLATDGTGYVPLASPANLYDQEPQGKKAINFRDYTVLLETWLQEELWPPQP